MAEYTQIPLIKNHGLSLKPEILVLPVRKFHWLLLILAGLLLYVWLKVETDLQLTRISAQEAEHGEVLSENERLRAEIVRLSSFERIQRIAQSRLGLEFVSDEQIIEVPKK